MNMAVIQRNWGFVWEELDKELGDPGFSLSSFPLAVHQGHALQQSPSCAPVPYSHLFPWWSQKILPLPVRKLKMNFRSDDSILLWLNSRHAESWLELQQAGTETGGILCNGTWAEGLEKVLAAIQVMALRFWAIYLFCLCIMWLNTLVV